ncbi:MAG TPA: DegV family protein [Firmicutes bacterium]|nr:DegV family protein [Bacillota bacterium]
MSTMIFDSNGELWYTRAEELGLDYISMPYYIDGQEYFYDLGKATDFRKFYDLVRAGNIPKTQALNPEDYKKFLTPYFERGEDILYISFSHRLSGTFQSLELALRELKESYPDRRCTVFDTNSISLGAGIQVEEAAKLRAKGASDEEILDFLKTFTDRVCVYFVVDDLMHLKRGGRCSGLAAVAGTVLGLKPMLSVGADGGLTVLSKIAGRKKAIRTLAVKVVEELTDESCSVYVVDADCPEEGDRLRDLILEKRPNAHVVRQIVGPVIGSHCGPGTLGVIFVGDHRPVPLEK